MEILTLVVVVFCFVLLSAICSGLNVALMSLDPADLKRKVTLNDPRAKKVIALRTNSHLTLAAILLTNVGVISATSLAIDNHFNGLIAGISSTLLIVVFGEIIPQAFFTRHALTLCARFSFMLKFMIVVTYPISKLLQLLLDKIFAEQESHLHSRHELGIIISEHIGHQLSDIDEDEAEIMRGALSLSHKHALDIMTDLADTYWLTPDTLIDASKIDEIQERNWSRIPIFNKNLTECYGVLLMKDLVDIDFDEQPVRVDALQLHQTKLIGSKTALDTLFRKFIGSRTHLMPIEKNDKIIGIITIEDLVEEILGHEIQDEADMNRVHK